VAGSPSSPHFFLAHWWQSKRTENCGPVLFPPSIGVAVIVLVGCAVVTIVFVSLSALRVGVLLSR
jgi:hypothetical protein